MPIFFLEGGYSNGVSWRAQLRKAEAGLKNLVTINISARLK
jgi:hypothetical protein